MAIQRSAPTAPTGAQQSTQAALVPHSHAAHNAPPPQALAPAAPHAPAALPPGVIVDFGVEITAPIPWVSIAQGSTVEARGLIAGLWAHASTGEQKETLTLQVTGILRQRSLLRKFNPRATEQPAPICFSLDGTTGLGSAAHDAAQPLHSPGVILPNDTSHNGAFAIEAGRNCEACAFAAWSGQSKAERTKPACAEALILCGFDADWGPVVLRIKGTGIAPWRAFYARWATQARRAIMQLAPVVPDAARELGRDAAPLAVTFDVGISQRDNYYVPTFGNLRPTGADEYAALAYEYGAIEAIRERITTRVEDAHAGDSEAATHAGAGAGAGNYMPGDV
jgi:hypothetical protein